MTEIDLNSCEQEPIHIPGSIQPHGILLGIRENDLEIVIASANSAELLGTERAVVGRNLADLLPEESLTELARALKGNPQDVNPLPLSLHDGASANGIAHRTDGLLVLEMEPASTDPASFSAAYRRMVRRFDRIRRAENVQEICDIAAREVRQLTGFDRVMVYKFDAHANGQVIAEDLAHDQEPFLGLHYPASDIPAQARRMYVENPLRLIVDVDYSPALLEPDTNPLTNRPLDLTHSTLRSVSPIHCEYLRNMGVAASMSISLLDGDQLWGLIACHHRTPLHVPYGTRMVAEFVSHVLSARITELTRLDMLSKKTAAYGIQARLIDDIVNASRLQEGLIGGANSLTDLVECDGAAIVYQGEVTTLGTAPTPEQIAELTEAIAQHAGGEVFATDKLSALHPPAAAYPETAAGAIVVPISTDGRDNLLWLRRERIYSVTWAGNPNKAVNLDASTGRLSPRGSFQAFEEAVRLESKPWESWEVEVASDFRTALAASVIHQAAELERLNTRLTEASHQKDRFLATVSHELRNPLNAIIGWVQLARLGLEGEKLTEALDIIERNASLQTDLINDLLDVTQIAGGRMRLDQHPVEIAQIIREAVASVTPAATAKDIELRTDIDESATHLLGDPGRLRQCIWNLLTNAVKFAKPHGGQISVTVKRTDSSILISVADTGKGIDPDLLPLIFDPFRQADEKGDTRSGLGLGLSIVKSIVELHGGDVAASSDGEGKGATFELRLPVAALSREVDVAESFEKQPDVVIDLSGFRILVVEDHEEAARMVAALLESRAAEVDTTGDGEQALQRLSETQYDVVVSDLDMPVMDGYGLVSAMRADNRLKDIPAIALTAYTRGGDRARALTEGFQHHVAKPVDPAELLAVIKAVVARLRGTSAA